MDLSFVSYSAKKAPVIRELAELAVGYTLENNVSSFRTDTLRDRQMQNKFEDNGYGGLVSITFHSRFNNPINGFPDSTVIFKQTGLRGITEIIYDFALVAKTYPDDTSNTRAFILLKVADRIYYRRRQVPLM